MTALRRPRYIAPDTGRRDRATRYPDCAVRTRQPFHATGLLLALIPAPLVAQDGAATVRLSGEVRLRAEGDGRTANFGDDAATLSRIRLGASVAARPWLRVFVQLQDARAWGTESNTLTDASADQLDLHQGYVEIDGLGVTARLGRQELNLGDERLVGSVGWTNTARSLDGAVVSRALGRAEVRAFWMAVAERDVLLATGLDPHDNEGLDEDGWLLGGWAAFPAGPATVELTLLHDRNALTDQSWTAGLRAHGRTGSLLFEAAGAYQFGADRAAYLASGLIGAAVGRATLAAQVDWLSGDGNPADADRGAFHTLYATNHKFYGFMDYFLAFPAQTQNAGLVDVMARASIALPAGWRARADLHHFSTQREVTGNRFLGIEGDLVVGRAIAPAAAFEAGASAFSPGDLSATLLPAFARGTDDITYWGYVMLTVRFAQ
jgi:hypothetical protein